MSLVKKPTFLYCPEAERNSAVSSGQPLGVPLDGNVQPKHSNLSFAIRFNMNTHTNSSRPDNRVVADHNEFKVLKLVRDFGHLVRIEVAEGVWPTSDTLVAQKMAQRTVKRLLKSRELLEMENLLAGNSLVLGRRGAARLRMADIEADAGYDLSSVNGGQFKHRSYGTRYLIKRHARGHRVFGEYAIAKGWSPLTRKQFSASFDKKIPDGLVLVPGPERGFDETVSAADWIEVECTDKSTKELERILYVAWTYLGKCLDAEKTIILDRVIIVFNEKERHERRIKQLLREYISKHHTDNPDALLASIILCRCKVDAPFVWHGHEEVDGATLLTESTHRR